MHTHSYTLLIVLFNNIISFHTFTEPVNYDEGHKNVIKVNSLDSVLTSKPWLCFLTLFL